MTAAAYREPYRAQAGVLALLVHAAFFTFLYFGVSWQTFQVESMSVELWDGLPVPAATGAEAAPPPPPQPIAPQPVEAAPVPAEVKPDIVLPDKQKPASRPPPKVASKPVEPTRKPSLLERYGIGSSDGGAASGNGRGAGQVQAEVARERAGRLSATQKIIAEYVARIRAKIKGNVIVPPDVPVNALVRFSVTVLPDGTVMSARLTQSSTFPAYDVAVERAILKSQPLPLPQDPDLFNNFRELRLCFSPFREDLCR